MTVICQLQKNPKTTGGKSMGDKNPLNFVWSILGYRIFLDVVFQLTIGKRNSGGFSKHFMSILHFFSTETAPIDIRPMEVRGDQCEVIRSHTIADRTDSKTCGFPYIQVSEP